MDLAGSAAGPVLLALDPAVPAGRLSVSFWIPAAVLTVALVVKLPTIIRLWQDPMLRAVGGLLPRGGPELRLTRRETFIRDVPLPPARRVDEELHRRAHRAALELGFASQEAGAPAAAVAVLDAVERREHAPGATVTATATPRNRCGRSAPCPGRCAAPTVSRRYGCGPRHRRGACPLMSDHGERTFPPRPGPGDDGGRRERCARGDGA